MRQWLLNNIALGKPQTPAEERANAATHAIGALLALIGTVFLLLRTARGGGVLDLVGAAIFGASMITLYGSSAAYHHSRDPVLKRFLRVMDHVSIYVLIAGTYTPITLAIRGRAGWALFAAIWGFALVGTVFKFYFWGRFRWLHVLIYVAMGWAIVVAWNPVMQKLPRELILWCFAGGVVYTVGAVLYAVRRIPYYHAIWHLFVLGGSACMYIGIYRNMLAI